MAARASKEHLTVGDPDADHEITAADRRRQKDSERTRDAVARMMAENPPRLSDAARSKALAILSVPTPDHELMRWRVRLFCGHVYETTAHASHTNPHQALLPPRCSECGLDP